MSWLGDMLLIPDGVKWFSSGGVAFLLSHLLFIFAYNESGIVFSAISPVVIVLVSLVYAVTVCLVFSKLRPSLPKGLFYPMFAYLLTNGAMNCFAWFRLLSGLYKIYLIRSLLPYANNMNPSAIRNSPTE